MAKKYKVLTPNKGFTGKRNGVHFENGVGHATKDQANELVNVWGYDCPELTGVNPDPKKKKDVDEPNGSRAIDNWQTAKKAVQEIDNVDDLKAFVVDEDRDSVLKAAAEREEDLVSEDDEDEPSPQPPSKGEEDSDDDEDSEEEKGSE